MIVEVTYWSLQWWVVSQAMLMRLMLLMMMMMRMSTLPAAEAKMFPRPCTGQRSRHLILLLVEMTQYSNLVPVFRRPCEHISSERQADPYRKQYSLHAKHSISVKIDGCKLCDVTRCVMIGSAGHVHQDGVWWNQPARTIINSDLCVVTHWCICTIVGLS